MRPSDLIDSVKAIYAAFQANDTDAVLAHFDEEIDWEVPGSPFIPLAGRREGREEVRKYFDGVSETVDVLKFEPEHFVVDCDRVIVFGSYEGTLRSTGLRESTSWVHVFTFKDTRVSKYREFVDTANFVAAIVGEERLVRFISESNL